MKKVIIFFIQLFLLSGCATTGENFSVWVNAIDSDDKLENKIAVILPASDKFREDDLQYQEFRKYLENVLITRNYKIVKSNDVGLANIAIVFAYGIGDPEEHFYTYSLPVFGQTGIASATTIGTANTNYFGSTNYSSSTTYNPSYGVVGSTVHQGSFITYTRYIGLEAYNLNLYRDKNEQTMLWKVEIISTGSSGDMRRAFPVLIAASSEYIGENTGRKLNIILNESDQKVLNVRGIETEDDNFVSKLKNVF